MNEDAHYFIIKGIVVVLIITAVFLSWQTFSKVSVLVRATTFNFNPDFDLEAFIRDFTTTGGYSTLEDDVRDSRGVFSLPADITPDRVAGTTLVGVGRSVSPFFTPPSSPVCGDGTCESPENTTTCIADCPPPPPICGNGSCESPESSTTCLVDCPAPVLLPVCGDGTCESPENTTTCIADCPPPTPICGNGSCESPEDSITCLVDCPLPAAVCGNGTCESPGEDSGICPADCPLVGCGNGTCEVTEDAASCPADCSLFIISSPVCGDGACELGETSTSCMIDCLFALTFAVASPVCGNTICEPPGEDSGSCPADCPPPVTPSCGNGLCESVVGESFGSCPLDCPPLTPGCGSCDPLVDPSCFAGGGGGTSGYGFCDSTDGETLLNCPEDCGGGSGGSCLYENICNQPGGCVTSSFTPPIHSIGYIDSYLQVCGDGLTDFGEDWGTTCTPEGKIEMSERYGCGNRLCERGEEDTCLIDCSIPAGTACGDGVCEGFESCITGGCSKAQMLGMGVCVVDCGDPGSAWWTRSFSLYPL